MSDARRPLAGRTVLVLGAGDPTAQRLALHLSARGAAIVAAGPVLDPVVVTAGLVAATGAVARVLEALAPPLVGAPLVRAAADALAAPTDAIVAESALGSPDAARAAAADLAHAMPPGARVLVLEARPVGGARAAADRLVEALLR